MFFDLFLKYVYRVVKAMKNGSNDYKPSVFWSFNDVLEKEELSKQLTALLDAGCSGGFLHSRVGLVTEYMSSEWMEVVRHCCEEAKKQGTSLWLYDEDRFPSGYAGGAVLAVDDSLRAKALCLIKENDLNQFHIIKSYKKVTFDGENYEIALCSAKDGNPNFEGKCYVDLLNPKTTEVFIQQTHEKYKEAVGEYFGKELKGIFSDEFCYTQKAAFSCYSVPFTNDLEKVFEKAYGYDLVSCIELLFFDGEGYRTLRRDFYEFLTNHFIESFTKPYNAWCEANNLIFTGHMVHEDFLTTQPEWTGAVMPHYPHMGMPGIDKLGSDPDYLLTVKQLTSVTDQLGRRSLCEAFGCSGHQFGPSEIKRVADWLCVLGIDFINPHLTLYSSRGERKRDYPPDFSWRQPWFKVSRNCFDHVSRVCELMNEGKVQTEVLVLHPIQSVWAEYSPLHKPNPVFSIWSPKNENAGQNFITEVENFQKPFLDLSNQLLEMGVNYHYGDEMILRDYGSFDDGITVGKCTYQKVIVPPVSILREETIRFLEQMAMEKGKDAVVFIKEIPECIPQALKEHVTVVKDVKSAVLKVSKEVKRPVEVRDIYSGQIADKIYYRCCQSEHGKQNIFVVNTSRERGYDVRIGLDVKDIPMLLDTVTGKMYKAPGRMTEQGFVCEVHLQVGGSLMFITGDSVEKEEARILQCGAIFKNNWRVVKNIFYPEYKVEGVNILPLNLVDYKVGEKVLKNRPVEGIWHQSFYKLENGTPFEAEYHFQVAEIPGKPIVAMIEVAQNLDEILINGEPAKIIDELVSEYFDKSFARVLLHSIHKGENVISIKGKKCNNINGIGSHVRVKQGTEHKATELEVVYLCGDFGVVTISEGEYTIVAPGKTLRGYTNSSLYPFYLGRLICDCGEITGGEVVRVNAKAHAAELKINGKSLGVAYMTPFKFEIPKNVNGNAEIVLYNSLENTHGPLHLAEREKFSMMGPVYFQDMKRYVKKPFLFDFGVTDVTILNS